MTHVEQEIASQPECWRRAAAEADQRRVAFPRSGDRVAAVGCGTSWFIGEAYAARREQAGHGETHAFPASEFPIGRHYDRIVAITRSGTTTEVLDLLRTVRAPVTTIVGDPASPAVGLSTNAVALPWADERSIVQTRFATSALALLRASIGEELDRVVRAAEIAVRAPLPIDPACVDQVTFLGRGWTVGLAHEAALKCREAAAFWTEAYPAMDFRHGPISICAPGRAVWAFGEIPAGLAYDVQATGATFVKPMRVLDSTLDPMAELILAQRFAVALAAHRGLDPDAPRNLSRSVVLAGSAGPASMPAP